MMKTSLLRHAAACRVAFAARPVQIAFRSSSAALGRSIPSRSIGAPRLPVRSLLRFYSSESAASELPDQQGQKPITRFKDLESLGVHSQIVNAITRGMGYDTMTDVQSATINPALAGKDVVAQAKTGTGKTLAFLVPIIQRIIADQPKLAYRAREGARSDDIRAIILSPTRELAEQIGVEARKLCAGTGVIVQTAVGGTQKREMLRRTRMMGCHLMVATPGRLHDLLSDASTGIDAPNLQALVLDEADRMLDVGFSTELEAILSFLPQRSDVPRQTLLYSATMPKNVVGLARKFIDASNFEFVQTIKADEAPTHERVPQFILPCKGYENMAPTLLELIRRDVKKSLENPEQHPFKAIVFLPTTSAVVTYSSIFRRIKYNDRLIPRVWDIHSKLTQQQRTRNATEFRGSASGILFSSDVTARGMDFPNVTHVIQVHLPVDREHYIHRIGRTGRAGKEGQAWLIVSDNEVPVARERLPGLPIQRATGFESAAVEATSVSDLPQTFEDVLGAAKKLPYELLSSMYTSYLGGAARGMDKNDLVADLNNMAKISWGLEEPPAVPQKMANLLGYVQGLRVQESHPVRQHRGGMGFRDGSGFRGRGGGRDSQDGFAMLERSSREYDQSRGRRQRATPSF
ncbi:hypothetical protein MFIFM68171_09148 [Madurella fahalii]|uniref:ATP-dependent RNA helicase n=1 Tax=Madurella fahalii TaxID=1157608 RepID=A0ABQ0GMF7_9PEZI